MNPELRRIRPGGVFFDSPFLEDLLGVTRPFHNEGALFGRLYRVHPRVAQMGYGFKETVILASRA